MGYSQGSCSSSGGSGKGRCVTEVVRGIAKAQRRAVAASTGSCSTSCEQSIEDLLSPTRPTPSSPRHNTIPFMLICKASCKTFIGNGVIKSSNGYFNCIESPIFRVKKFVEGSDSCVILELLKPVRSGGGSSRRGENTTSEESAERGSKGSERGCTCGCGGSVCGFFPDNRIRSFHATGVCITIDLNCFCGITCLEAVTIN